jgi:hypothetical protein
MVSHSPAIINDFQLRTTMRAGNSLAVLATVLCLLSASAYADEQIVPLAQSGDWAAVAHKESETAPPDVCIAANVADPHVVFRADSDGVQFRVSNESWSLPAGVTGNVVVTIGEWSNTFAIDQNTDTMVNAEAAQDVVSAVFAAMDKASAMTVTAGKAKPFSVALTGSTKATNAFLTCAGIKSNAPGGGDNPFK